MRWCSGLFSLYALIWSWTVTDVAGVYVYSFQQLIVLPQQSITIQLLPLSAIISIFGFSYRLKTNHYVHDMTVSSEELVKQNGHFTLFYPLVKIYSSALNFLR